jgi:N-acetylmuramoyl-L-alanine amidase
MNIQRDLLTVNPFSRPGKKLDRVKGLVIHWVANAGSTAKQNRDFFESLKKQNLNGDQKLLRWASAHFIVGISGDVVQCIPGEEMAYHVGAKSYTPEALGRFGHYPNNCTIGIELCHPGPDGRFTVETLNAAAELCGLLCIQAGLNPLHDIWRHYDITGKDCPKWFIAHPDAFEEFRRSVVSAVNFLRR